MVVLARVANDHDVRFREPSLCRDQRFGKIASVASTDKDQHLLTDPATVLGTSLVLEAVHTGLNWLFAKMLMRPSRKIGLGCRTTQAIEGISVYPPNENETSTRSRADCSSCGPMLSK